MAKVTKTTKKQEGEKPSSRWTLGLFRNVHGRLVGAYVRTDGSPMPSEERRVGAKPALYHGTYTDMTYAEARVVLRKEATERGLVDEPVGEEKPAKSAKAPKAPAKKGTPAKKKASKKTVAKKPVAKKRTASKR
jgi:hypothetical protein